MRDRHALIDFVGIGPQRTGTTWLHACLCGHPELCLPRRKETYFFDRYYDRGLGWYQRQFKCSPALIRGEIGASYFSSMEALQRIHGHNEMCKVIVNLRDPVARIFSFYLHYRRKGRLRGDFGSALREMPGLFDSSRYEVMLPRWIERFGRDHVMVILLEDVATHPEEELQRVYGFLHVDEWLDRDVIGRRIYPASTPKYPRMAQVATQISSQLHRRDLRWALDFARRMGIGRIYHGGAMGLSLDSEIRASLIERFLPTIKYVEELLGRPLPEWRATRKEPARSAAVST